MKRLLPILAILVPVIVSFVMYYLETEKSDVVYSISDNIPVSNSKSVDINTQQIEIVNLGTLTAKDIQLKIDADITNYRVINDSASDKVDVYTENTFELIYSELPPDGKFTLVIESDIQGLDENTLTIKSDAGKARNGLENEKNTNKIGLLLIYIVILLIYILLSLLNLRSWYTYSKIRRSIFSSLYNIDYIFSKKPFYFKDTEWKEFIKFFIEEQIKSDLSNNYHREVETLNAYKILLKKGKPEYLSIEEWNDVRKKAVDVFGLKIRQALLSTSAISYDSNIVSFLTNVSEAIENLSDSIKREISFLISSEYTNLKSKRGYNLQVINNFLSEAKPRFVIQSDWDKYLDFLSEMQYMLLLQELYKSYNDPLSVISQYENVIVKHKDELKELAYSISYFKFIIESLRFNDDLEFKDMPEWIKENHKIQLNRISNVIKNSKNDIEKSNNKLHIIDKLIIKGETLEEEKSDIFNDYEWKLLKHLSEKLKRIDEFEINYQSRRETLEKEEYIVEKLKEKIRYQLNTIHLLLNDPSTIDRIESYDNYFAKGNYENLVKLAAMLKDIKS